MKSLKAKTIESTFVCTDYNGVPEQGIVKHAGEELAGGVENGFAAVDSDDMPHLYCSTKGRRLIGHFLDVSEAHFCTLARCEHKDTERKRAK